jgi:hypothetical protein
MWIALVGCGRIAFDPSGGGALDDASMSVRVIVLTSGTTWTVPSDWSSNNSVECIGGGVVGLPDVRHDRTGRDRGGRR